MDDITKILNASRPSDIFSKNAKQSRIIYLNLMRKVHPDLNPDNAQAEEATKRLSELWSMYQKNCDDAVKSGSASSSSSASPSARRRATARKKPIEITRNERYVLFNDDGKLLLVNRYTSGCSSMPADDKVIDSIWHDFEGSPVLIMNNTDDFLLAQSDGNHCAYHIENGNVPLSEPMYFLDDLLNNHVSELEPEDAVWLMKRIIFIAGVLDKYNMSLPEKMTPLIVPSNHAMIIPEQNDISSGISSWRDDMLDILAEHVDDHHMTYGSSSSSNKYAATKQFLYGIKYMNSSSDMLRWTDDFAVHTFGKIAFHHMLVH